MTELIKATSNNTFEIIEGLAREILPEVYESIIDKEHIHYLLEKSHSARAIDDHVSNKNYEYYLITNSDTKVGYLGMELLSGTLVISKLYILKSYRSKGIGKIVMSYVNEMAKRMSFNKIELTVHKLNQRSVDFYTKDGFVITDSLFHEFENGHSLQGYQMTKVLYV